MSSNVAQLPTSTSSKKTSRARGGQKHAALTVAWFNRFRGGLALMMPTWAAMFGWLGGAFAHEGQWLAYWAYGLVLLVYAVSLPHVIDGLQRITGAHWRDALCMGIVADAAMVSAETFIHFGEMNLVCIVIASVAGFFGLVTASYANFVAFSHPKH